MYEEDKKTDRGQDSGEQTSDDSSEGTSDGPPRIRNQRIETRAVTDTSSKEATVEFMTLPSRRHPLRPRKKED